MAPCETHCDAVSFAAPQILKHPWMKQTQRNKHLANAMQNLRQFNARRKLRVSVNGLVISVGCTGSPTSFVRLCVAQAAALACVVGGRLGTRSSLASLVGETNCTWIAVQHNIPLSGAHTHVPRNAVNIGELRRLRKAFFRICGGRETDLSQFNEVGCSHELATLLLQALTVSDGHNIRLFTRLDTVICQVSASLSCLTPTLMASWTTRSSSVASAHSRATTKMHCEVRAHHSSPAREPTFSLPASHSLYTYSVL